MSVEIAESIISPTGVPMTPTGDADAPPVVVIYISQGYEAKRALQWRINWLRDNEPLCDVHIVGPRGELVDRIRQNLRDNGHSVGVWFLLAVPNLGALCAQLGASLCFLYAAPQVMQAAIADARQTAGETDAMVVLFDDHDNEVQF